MRLWCPTRCLGVCGGPCLLDADNDGWCDECEGGNTAGYQVSMETVTVHAGGSLMAKRPTGCTQLPERDRLCVGMFGTTRHPSSFNPRQERYNDPSSTTWNAQGINPEFLSFFPELAYDSFLTIGAEDASTPAAASTTVWGTVDASAEFVGGPGSNLWWMTPPEVRGTPRSQDWKRRIRTPDLPVKICGCC